MLTVDVSGNVQFEHEGNIFSLNGGEDYQEFLLWLTSPDDAIVIEKDDFDIASGCPGESLPLLERYRDFLVDFVDIRNQVLADAATSKCDVRTVEAEVNRLIYLLKKQESDA